MSLDSYNANKYFNVFGRGQTPNPFYSISNQFVPRNLHDVIKWSRYILTQSPTTVEVIRKLATYPITDFHVDSSSKSVREKYEEIFKSIRLKNVMNDVGFDYYTLGNVYVSIYFPIIRMLVCPQCGSEYDAKNIGKSIKFNKFKFSGSCLKPDCHFVGDFDRKDRRSNNIGDINIIKWPAENISVNHNPITGASEYYYKFPNTTKRKIMMGDPSFVATVPWSMVEAVKNNQDFKFDPDSIFHLRSISMGDVLEGMGMPPVISLYSSIFHQTMLKRANEAIATEHMTPYRILYPQQASGAGDPISMMSMGNFVQNMEGQLKKFKGDPNHITIAPIPVGYQAVGGQGRALLVSQELQFIEESILMGMGVSREMLSGTTNWTSSTVGLRLLENTMNDYTSQVRELIEWVMEKIASYLNISNEKVSLAPFQLMDDQMLKQALPAFFQQGIVSESTTLKAFDIDFNEEQEQIKKDAIAKAEAEVEKEHEVKMAVFMKTKDINSEEQDDNGYKETQDKAKEYADKILAMTDPDLQAKSLYELYYSDMVMYTQVAELLQKYSAMRTSTVEEAQTAQQSQEMNGQLEEAAGEGAPQSPEEKEKEKAKEKEVKVQTRSAKVPTAQQAREEMEKQKRQSMKPQSPEAIKQ